jgi:hypothetical protein
MSEAIEVRDYTIGAGASVDVMGVASFFQYMSGTGAVDVEFFRGNSTVGKALGMPAGFKYGPLREGEVFDRVKVTSAIAQTVKLCIATSQADLLQLTGTVTVTLGSAITDIAPVAVGVAAVQAIAAGASRHRVTIQAQATNTGIVYVGGAGVTTLNSPYALLPGDIFEELAAPDAAIFVISDTAAQSVRVQAG